jgi:hypothetical protein
VLPPDEPPRPRELELRERDDALRERDDALRDLAAPPLDDFFDDAEDLRAPLLRDPPELDDFAPLARDLPPLLFERELVDREPDDFEPDDFAREPDDFAREPPDLRALLLRLDPEDEEEPELALAPPSIDHLPDMTR